MAKEILYFELNMGARIPSVGLGTWQSEPGIIGQAVEAAIKIGYRHMDCSPYYHNEKEIGYRHIDCAQAYNNEKELSHCINGASSIMELWTCAS